MERWWRVINFHQISFNWINNTFKSFCGHISVIAPLLTWSYTILVVQIHILTYHVIIACENSLKSKSSSRAVYCPELLKTATFNLGLYHFINDKWSYNGNIISFCQIRLKCDISFRIVGCPGVASIVLDKIELHHLQRPIIVEWWLREHLSNTWQ